MKYVHLIHAALLISICGSCGDNASGELFAVERGKAAAAEAIAMNVTDGAPAPTPEPGPSGEDCTRCNGTGKVPSGDGLSRYDCPDCGGDGKQTNFDKAMSMVQTGNAQRAELLQRIAALEARLSESKITTMRIACNCAVTGVCTCAEGECRCVNCPKHSKGSFQDKQVNLETASSTAEAMALSIKHSKPALLFFTTPTCGPCLERWNTVIKSQIVSKVLSDRYIVASIDIMQMTEDQRRAWNVETVPRTLVVTADWKKRDEIQIVGTEPAEFAKLLAASLAWADTRSTSATPPTDAVAQWVWMGPSQGSAGGTYRGGYARGGSAGGNGGYAQYPQGYARGYSQGSAGGVPSQYYQQYQQPQYAQQEVYYEQPVYYSQPTNNGFTGFSVGGYGVGFSGSGRQWVCDESGCGWR